MIAHESYRDPVFFLTFLSGAITVAGRCCAADEVGTARETGNRETGKQFRIVWQPCVAGCGGCLPPSVFLCLIVSSTASESASPSAEGKASGVSRFVFSWAKHGLESIYFVCCFSFSLPSAWHDCTAFFALYSYEFIASMRLVLQCSFFPFHSSLTFSVALPA